MVLEIIQQSATATLHILNNAIERTFFDFKPQADALYVCVLQLCLDYHVYRENIYIQKGLVWELFQTRGTYTSADVIGYKEKSCSSSAILAFVWV